MNCPHGMPSRGSCVECMEEGPVSEPATWMAVGGRFVARFDGDCPGCGARLLAGETAVQRYDLGEERTAYVHADLGCRP